MRRFRTCTLDQPLLLAPSLQDWLPEHHLARFIAEVVGELNLEPILAVYQRKDHRGAEGYHPEMLTRLLLYGYATGLTSSRRIEKATYDNVAYRYLAADQHPDHDTIAAFRQQHLDALAQLFVHALQLCSRAGLVKLGNVAIDGTKLKASASFHRGKTHARMSEEERKLTELVNRWMEEAQQTDAAEDARFGKGKSEQELPEKLANVQRRLERIRQAKQELEEEAKQRLEQAQRDYPARKRGPAPKQGATQPPLTPDERQAREKYKSRLKKARENAQQPKRYYNFTDPESRMMMDRGQRHLVYAYNAQAAVDGHAQVIVSAALTQEETDHRMLLPMAAAVEQAMGAKPAAITADAGYWDTENINSDALKGMLVLVNPDGGKKNEEGEPRRTNPTMERMRELLKTDETKALYDQRKTIVEPVFGQIKQQRGIREFRLRGLKKTKAEWLLICLTHNLLKLYRHDWLPKRTNGVPESGGKPGNGPKSSQARRCRTTKPSNRQNSAEFQQNGRHRCLHGPSRRPRPTGLGDFIPTGSYTVPETPWCIVRETPKPVLL
jgi:transposase